MKSKNTLSQVSSFNGVSKVRETRAAMLSSMKRGNVKHHLRFPKSIPNGWNVSQ